MSDFRYPGLVYWKDTVRLSFEGITKNKVRSALTSLGIIIGVSSVTLMMSLGNSFQGYIVDQIQSMGEKTIGISPKGIHHFGGDLTRLTYDDYEAVRKLSTVTSVSPGILVPEHVTYKTETISPFLIAGTTSIFTNYGMRLESGRLLDENDEHGAKSVVVLGHKTAVDLFGDDEPLGKRIALGNAYFTVVGVLKQGGSLLLSQLDNSIVLPYSTGKQLTGQRYLSFISLQATDDAELAVIDVKDLLRRRHHIKNPTDDPDQDDFDIESTAQVIDIVDTVSVGLTLFLALIAAISLIVGGIGIMNVMLASVLERTHEIGLRKAVGARKKDILHQFLLESLYLTVFGSIVGLTVGILSGWVFVHVAASYLGAIRFVLSPISLFLSTGMALATGLIFGITPAQHAASMDPIEALRRES